MHSSQYTALAQWADDQGCTITAMHFMPGATQWADGAWLLLDRSVGHQTSYAIVSVHVTVPARPGQARAADPTMEVEDLCCGDRTWRPHALAWAEFAAAVANDSEFMDGEVPA